MFHVYLMAALLANLSASRSAFSKTAVNGIASVHVLHQDSGSTCLRKRCHACRKGKWCRDAPSSKRGTRVCPT